MDKNGLLRLVLGLSIAGTSLAVARPASATVWKNLADERFCLATANSGSMDTKTNLIIWECNTDKGKPVADQGWELTATPWDSTGNYLQMFNTKPNSAPPSNNARCAGSKAGFFTAGNPLILWTCNNASAFSHDQGWHLFNVGVDRNQHQCFMFLNEMGYEDPTDPEHLILRDMGVNNASMTNGSQVVLKNFFSNTRPPDQIWCAY